ncbi:hypothetical protein ALC62_01565 [Cyphomyrmex costatus]|uniref:Uncharacterized protein n=1 Tax=Cyphomyrmex costatus TaxID=456900 RepID=A0A195D386_9HYME|nr:hypothetical protein ALC62_01565 [Cyphomyrmex costatus]
MMYSETTGGEAVDGRLGSLTAHTCTTDIDIKLIDGYSPATRLRGSTEFATKLYQTRNRC